MRKIAGSCKSKRRAAVEQEAAVVLVARFERALQRAGELMIVLATHTNHQFNAYGGLVNVAAAQRRRDAARQNFSLYERAYKHRCRCRCVHAGCDKCTGEGMSEVASFTRTVVHIDIGPRVLEVVTKGGDGGRATTLLQLTHKLVSRVSGGRCTKKIQRLAKLTEYLVVRAENGPAKRTSSGDGFTKLLRLALELEVVHQNHVEQLSRNICNVAERFLNVFRGKRERRRCIRRATVDAIAVVEFDLDAAAGEWGREILARASRVLRVLRLIAVAVLERRRCIMLRRRVAGDRRRRGQLRVGVQSRAVSNARGHVSHHATVVSVVAVARNNIVDARLLVRRREHAARRRRTHPTAALQSRDASGAVVGVRGRREQRLTGSCNRSRHTNGRRVRRCIRQRCRSAIRHIAHLRRRLLERRKTSCTHSSRVVLGRVVLGDAVHLRTRRGPTGRRRRGRGARSPHSSGRVTFTESGSDTRTVVQIGGAGRTTGSFGRTKTSRSGQQIARNVGHIVLDRLTALLHRAVSKFQCVHNTNWNPS